MPPCPARENSVPNEQLPPAAFSRPSGLRDEGRAGCGRGRRRGRQTPRGGEPQSEEAERRVSAPGCPMFWLPTLDLRMYHSLPMVFLSSRMDFSTVRFQLYESTNYNSKVSSLYINLGVWGVSFQKASAPAGWHGNAWHTDAGSGRFWQSISMLLC